jgi:hypothetical protein
MHVAKDYGRFMEGNGRTLMLEDPGAFPLGPDDQVHALKSL